VSTYHVAPAALIRGSGALRRAVPEIASLGRDLLWVTGETGADRVPSDLRDGLVAEGTRLHEARHRGPCSDHAVAALRSAAERVGAHGLVAIGGGRVIDAAKAAADDIRMPFAAVPTSPATCAAVTPLAVVYTPDGRYRRTRPTRRAPDVAVLDPDLLTGAHDRLLAAGILDALAKVHEVRRTLGDAGRRSAGAAAALALCDHVDALLARHAETALAEGPDRDDARTLVAEACVLGPGLIGGLAGEEAKLAAAHPLHNALTALPGSRSALHGELVGFGVLVQIELTGAGETAVRAAAARFARLGVACHLDAVGCADARGEAGRAAARETVATPAMRAAFADVDADALFDALLRVDGWARAEAERVAAHPA
jgi:glycerol dehydrogenase